MKQFSLVIALLVCGSLAAETAPDLNAPYPVKSLSKLGRILAKRRPKLNLTGKIQNTGGDGQTPGAPETMTGAPGDANGTAGGAGGGKFSGTNLQIAGVDEADRIKTDGEYTFQVSNTHVLVIKATPAAEMAVVSTLDFGSDFYPYELYVTANRLVVIGVSFGQNTLAAETGMPIVWRQTTQALVYDTADKTKLTQIRKLEVDGYYISSRRIEDNLYLIARSYPQWYALLPMADAGNAGGTTTTNKALRARKVRRKSRKARMAEMYAPRYSDSAKPDATYVEPEKVFYFPGFDEPDYLIVSAFNLADATQPADVKAYLGGGEQIYSAQNNLYVAATKYSQDKETFGTSTNTTIYKFTLKDGSSAFAQRAEVPGRILNQFSMDEYNGFFRAATTNGFFGDQQTQSNGVYVFDANLKLAGKVENIAPNEQIFAARFMGERCYLVTFRQIDPLFVIGLSDPGAPEVLGELKVTGVSTYLQAYDATHLLGIGMNTNSDGQLDGIKLTLFDVSDVKNPVEQHTAVIAGGYAWTPAEYEHRALLFDRDKHLLAFPVTRYSEQAIPLDPLSSYQWTPPWMGAYVYDLSLENGFVLKKTITHDANDNLNFIQRLLYIGNTLYSHSYRRVQAHDLTTFDLIKSLDLPFDPYLWGFGGGGVIGAPGSGTTTGSADKF